MIELTLRVVVALAWLIAAAVAPAAIALSGDPALAAATIAVGVPIAALLLAGAMVEHTRHRANRRAMRAWSRREHPANAPARGAHGAALQPPRPRPRPRPTLVAVPDPDPVDAHADQLARVLYLGRHAVDTPTTAVPQAAVS